MSEKIWYISYGSNILEERFQAYLTGVGPNYISTHHKGSRDGNAILERKAVVLSHSLYFAKSSKSWLNKGVAFIESVHNAATHTLGRGYLISATQFEDVYIQENGKDPSTEVLGKSWMSLEEGESLCLRDSWYGRILRLQDMDGNKSFTFTAPIDAVKKSSPSLLYLSVIAKGIREAHDLSFDEIANYFYGYEECTSEYSLEQILEAISRPSLDRH